MEVKPEMQVEFFDMSAHAGHDDSVKVTALEGYVERFTRDDIEKMYTMMNIAQYGKPHHQHIPKHTGISQI